MNPLELLEKEFPNLTKSEQMITRYILDHPMFVIRFSLTQIAKEAKTSNTAIIRLCQKLGCQGFSEFKFSLSRTALSDTHEGDKEGSRESDDSMRAIVSQYVKYLNQMAAETDMDQIRRAKIALAYPGGGDPDAPVLHADGEIAAVGSHKALGVNGLSHLAELPEQILDPGHRAPPIIFFRFTSKGG